MQRFPPTATNPYAPVAVLQQDPAATLWMPGADALDSGPGIVETTPFRGGYQPASIYHLFGTQANPVEVFAFYDRALRAAGYAFVPHGVVRATTESDAWGWCKSQAAVHLGIIIQAKFDLTAVLQGRTYQTVYEATLTGRDPAFPCPVAQGVPTPSHR